MARYELTFIGGPNDLERRALPEEPPSVYLLPVVNMDQLSEWATDTASSELHLDVARYRTYKLPTYVSKDQFVYVGVYDG